MKPFTTIAMGIFLLICLVHIARLVYGVEIVIGGWVVPLWVSIPGAIITGGLAFMLWKEMRQNHRGMDRQRRRSAPQS